MLSLQVMFVTNGQTDNGKTIQPRYFNAGGVGGIRLLVSSILFFSLHCMKTLSQWSSKLGIDCITDHAAC